MEELLAPRCLSLTLLECHCLHPLPLQCRVSQAGQKQPQLLSREPLLLLTNTELNRVAHRFAWPALLPQVSRTAHQHLLLKLKKQRQVSSSPALAGATATEERAKSCRNQGQEAASSVPKQKAELFPPQDPVVLRAGQTHLNPSQPFLLQLPAPSSSTSHMPTANTETPQKPSDLTTTLPLPSHQTLDRRVPHTQMDGRSTKETQSLWLRAETPPCRPLEKHHCIREHMAELPRAVPT